MKKIILLVLLTVISITSIANADQHSGSYSVQIATYKNLPENYVASAEKFGRVYTSHTNRLTRVSVGKFDSRNKALDLLSQLKQAGYQDAFISRTESSAASAHQHDNSHHHDSPESEMAKFRDLPDADKEHAVFVDGKLHLKEGSRFIPVP